LTIDINFSAIIAAKYSAFVEPTVLCFLKEKKQLGEVETLV